MKIQPSEAIKSHPLYSGSNEEMEVRWERGVTLSVIRERIANRKRCSDLTPAERSWIRLWEDELKKHS